jgi:hypothetical protein
MKKHIKGDIKTIFIAKTRWEYYASNIIGFTFLTGLIIWLLYLSVVKNGIDLKSFTFWMAIVLLIIVPFSIISFFSSMKTVEVTQKGLLISYVFQKHTNAIDFSEITKIKSHRTDHETVKFPRSIHDTFTLILADGRTFDFSKSQFNNYSKLKSYCYKRCSERQTK